MNTKPSYPTYQESGPFWFGAIPYEWSYRQVKYVADLAMEKAPPSESVKYVGMENVKSGVGSFVETREQEPNGPSLSFKDGDVLFGKLRPYLAKSWLASFSGVCSSEFLVLRAREVSPGFLKYITLSREFVTIVDSSTYGAKMPRASWDYIGLLKIPTPDFDTSEYISKFLDYETAKLDSLIEKQQQLIALLEEKRQAVISHAVTKGLNPDAPMRDSGVEWLGDIPSHWTPMSIRNLIRKGALSIQDGNHGESHPKSSEFKDSGIPFLMAGNMNRGNVDLTGCNFITKSRTSELRLGPAVAGDILLSHKGNQLGEVASIPLQIDYPCVVLTPQITYYRAEQPSLERDFLFFVLQSTSFQAQLWFFASIQATRPYVGLITQRDLRLAVPPKGEQWQLVEFLKETVGRLDTLLGKAEQAIELLQERRTALISAAVTGKIDVRGWKPPTSDPEAEIP